MVTSMSYAREYHSLHVGCLLTFYSHFLVTAKCLCILCIHFSENLKYKVFAIRLNIFWFLVSRLSLVFAGHVSFGCAS